MWNENKVIEGSVNFTKHYIVQVIVIYTAYVLLKYEIQGCIAYLKCRLQ